jgi:hypothetical protein
MKVLIGVDPHKVSVAIAAVEEATGQLLERASFPQDRAGLRYLERFKRSGSPNACDAASKVRRTFTGVAR